MLQDIFSGKYAAMAGGAAAEYRVPGGSIQGYRMRNLTGCIVHIEIDGKDQDEVGAFTEATGYLGYPGQPIQQLRFHVTVGDPVLSSSAYPSSSWRCLLELVPIDLPTQRVPFPVADVSLVPGTGVGVQNMPGTLLSTGLMKEYLGVLPLAAGPYASLTKIGTYAVKQEFNALYLGTGGASCSRVQVVGATGLVYYDGPTTALVNVVVPLLSGADSTVDVWVQTTFAAGFFVNATGIRHPILSVPENFGAPPLIVQPASGSSQTVVPGTSAAVSVSTSGSSVPFTVLQAGVSRPVSIYGVFAWFQATFTETNLNKTDGMVALIILRGSTSLKLIVLGTIASFTPLTTANPTAFQMDGSLNNIFPFPLSGQSLFPADTAVDIGYGANALGTISAGVSLLTG